MHPTQKKLVSAVHAEFDRVKKDVAPRLPRPATMSDDAFKIMGDIQYAQNTLRTCMEASLIRMTPYSHLTSVELAVRLASYALSIVPLEDQDYVVSKFLGAFADAHQMRIAKGIAIATVWQMKDGRQMPNLPDGND